MGGMRQTVLRTTSVALCACIAALVVACGSGTRTVTVSSVPPVSQTSTTTKPQTSTKTTSTAPTPTPTTSTSTSTGTTSTRAAPEPAFTQHEAKSEGLSAAAAVVREKGFTPNNTSDYHSDQALRVLVGTRTGSSDGYGQQAFFFLNGRYIG